MSFIIFVASFIMISTFPGEHTHPILLIILVLTFIHVALLIIEPLLPFALAMLQTILELSDINAAVLPLVLALGLWLAHDVGACVAVAVREDV